MIKNARLTKRKRTTRGKGEKDRMEWALVSKKNPKKILKWFGPRKPSKKEVAKEERRVHSFASNNSFKQKKIGMTMIKELVNLANSLDEKGLFKEADVLDEIIKKSSEKPEYGSSEWARLKSFRDQQELEGRLTGTLTDWKNDPQRVNPDPDPWYDPYDPVEQGMVHESFKKDKVYAVRFEQGDAGPSEIIGTYGYSVPGRPHRFIPDPNTSVIRGGEPGYYVPYIPAGPRLPAGTWVYTDPNDPWYEEIK